MCPEFRTFVEAAEKQLLLLFRSIDRDKDGRLNKKELQAAFQRAGLSVPNKRLSGFFDELDLNNDGFITFDEWRYVLSYLCLVCVSLAPFRFHRCCASSLTTPCRDPPECGLFVVFLVLFMSKVFPLLALSISFGILRLVLSCI